MSLHPAYSDIGKYTDQLLASGHSVLQLAQLPGGERQHSLGLLQLLAPPLNAEILSLGSGVGGMERYWQSARPDLNFTLVNISAEQQAAALCKGELVTADANAYVPTKRYDVVVIAYALGHLHWLPVLKRAVNALRPGGKLFLYDIFNVSERFETLLRYAAPRLREIEMFGTVNDLRFHTVLQGCFHPEPFLKDIFENLAPGLSSEGTGALFIFEKPR